MIFFEKGTLNCYSLEEFPREILLIKKLFFEKNDILNSFVPLIGGRLLVLLHDYAFNVVQLFLLEKDMSLLNVGKKKHSLYLSALKTGEVLLFYRNEVEMINVDSPQDFVMTEDKAEYTIRPQTTGDLWNVNKKSKQIEIRPEFVKLFSC